MKALFSHVLLVFALALVATAAAKAGAATLPDIVRETIQNYFGQSHFGTNKIDWRTVKLTSRDAANQGFKRKAGVFVTLSRDGKTRACWGSVYPVGSDLVSATAQATVAAITKDYRFKPIAASEVPYLKPQVTLIESVEPMTSISGFDPLQDGLLVRSGGRSGVLLPREATDATYALVQCKLKGGIRAGEPCQLYRLKAHIYE